MKSNVQLLKFPVCKAVSAVYQSIIYQNNLERFLTIQVQQIRDT